MRLLIIACCLTVFGACKEEVQWNMSEEKMVAVMSDMLLAEAAINRINRGDADSVEQLYYQQIYTIHGIDSSLFIEDLALLGKDNARSFRVYKAIEERVSGRLKTVKSEEEEEKEAEKKAAEKRAEAAKKKGLEKAEQKKKAEQPFTNTEGNNSK